MPDLDEFNSPLLACGHIQGYEPTKPHDVVTCEAVTREFARELKAELEDPTTRVEQITTTVRGRGDERIARIEKRTPNSGPHRFVVSIKRDEADALSWGETNPWVLSTSGCDPLTFHESFAHALSAGLVFQAQIVHRGLIPRAELDALFEDPAVNSRGLTPIVESTQQT